MATSRPSRPDQPKLLGVRATPEQRRVLQEAARREHRSVSSFVLQAAMRAASTPVENPPQQQRTPLEIGALLAETRRRVAAANPENRDLLEEFLAERRAAAALE